MINRECGSGCSSGAAMETPYQIVRTPILAIAYKVSGPTDGLPVILLHGWPSDPHDYDNVLPALVEAHCRVYVPWLRGFGPTRFLESATLRSGQQAALGADLRDLWRRLRSIGRLFAATIGVVVPPVSSLPCGLSEYTH
jgi:pimeloyl-ACP methyl ester carboxylesterase